MFIQVDYFEPAQNIVHLKMIPRIDYSKKRGILRVQADVSHKLLVYSKWENSALGCSFLYHTIFNLTGSRKEEKEKEASSKIV
jgi:hypothetical protein